MLVPVLGHLDVRQFGRDVPPWPAKDPQHFVRPVNLIGGDEIHRTFRNEDESGQEGNVEAGQDDGKHLPVRDGAHGLTEEDADRPRHGGHRRQPAAPVRRGDLHRVHRGDGRAEPDARSVQEPTQEHHPGRLGRGDQDVTRRQGPADTDDVGPLAADVIGDGSGQQAAE